MGIRVLTGKDIADAARRNLGEPEPTPITNADIDAEIRQRWPGAKGDTVIPEWLRVYVRSLRERVVAAERRAIESREEIRKHVISHRMTDRRCLICGGAWNVLLHRAEIHAPACPAKP